VVSNRLAADGIADRLGCDFRGVIGVHATVLVQIFWICKIQIAPNSIFLEWAYA
jgi:hypothetical protein